MMEPEATRDMQQVARALVRSRHGVIFTGAGVSVDSGIPDFRSRGGLWQRFDPMEYATIDAFRRHPERVWDMLTELDQLLRAAQPNPAHRAMARLEQLGLVDGIVTQNVDNLHQRAGSRRVVEFHGNGSRLRCLDCGAVLEADAGRKLGLPPRCPHCTAVLKPDVVLFGEMIPTQAVEQAEQLVQGCRVMLVAGTSAAVFPASMLPVQAKRNGALLVELNISSTELTQACDATIQGRVAQSMPLLVQEMERLLELDG